jgi:hypothetical protein
MAFVVQTQKPDNAFEAIVRGLGTGIGEGIQTRLGEMLQQKQSAKQLQGLAPLFKQLGLQDEEIGTLLQSGIDPKMAAGLALDVSGQRQRQQQLEQQYKQHQETLEHQLRLAEYKETAKSSREAAKQALTREENDVQQKKVSNAFKRAQELIPYTGNTKIPFTKSFGGTSFNREAVQKRREIDTIGFFLADKAYTSLNKGIISESKLELIKEMAMNSNDSERTYQGKLDGLKVLEGLPPDTTEEEFDRVMKKELKKIDRLEEQDAKVQKARLGPPPKGKTWVINPKTKKVVAIENENLKEALANGGKLA